MVFLVGSYVFSSYSKGEIEIGIRLVAVATVPLRGSAASIKR